MSDRPVIVLCPHFAPDTAPTGTVMTRIVAELVDRGHRVHVVTSLPWYRNHRIEPGWDGRWVRRETTSWGSITRVHPFPGEDKSNLVRRAIGFVGYSLLAGVQCLRVGGWGRRAEAVIAMSPPLTLGLTGWVASRVRRAPLIFNIQDVFPDAAVETGAITNRHVIAAASWLERISYRAADVVTVLSDDLRDNVAAKLPAATIGKVHVIPNFVDTDAIRPMDRDTPYRRELGLGDATVVLYAGNVGFSQSLDLVLLAARSFAVSRPDVVFVINGGGAARPDLEVAAADLPNVRFIDMQPAERLPEVLAAADVHVVPLRAGLAWSSVPSKLYSILAAGRPVLASVDEGTEVARTVEAAGAGRAVPPEDPAAFLSALRDLLADRSTLAAAGASGRAFVEAWVSPDAVAGRYATLFDELRAARDVGR